MKGFYFSSMAIEPNRGRKQTHLLEIACGKNKPTASIVSGDPERCAKTSNTQTNPPHHELSENRENKATA